MFTEYPYRDFANYNLDWIIKRVKEFIAKFQELQDATEAELEAIRLEFADLTDFVNNYFNNLDVQEEINAKLDDMADSGELANIFEQAFRIIRQFHAQRYCRVVMNWSTSALQSMAYAPNGSITDNAPVLYLGGNLEGATNSYIYKVNFASGAVETQTALPASDFGHMNDMSYYNGKLYVTPGSDGEENIRVYEVTIGGTPVSPTYTITKEWNMSELLPPFLEGRAVGNVYGIGTGNADKPLVFAAWSGDYRREYFFSMNPAEDDGAITLEGSIYLPVKYDNAFKFQKQGIIVHGNDVYGAHMYPRALVRYHLGDPDNVYTIINLGEGNGHFPYGELEGGCMIGEDLFINSAVFITGGAATRGFFNIWRTNLTSNAISEMYTGDPVQATNYCYVNTSSTVTNPSGSEIKPFQSLEEFSAVHAYRQRFNNPQFFDCYIYGSNQRDVLQIVDCGLSISVDAANPATAIENIRGYNCQLNVRRGTISNVYLKGCSAVFSGSTIASIQCDDSQVYFDHCTTSNYQMNRTNVTLYGCSDDLADAAITANSSRIEGVAPLNNVRDSHTMSTGGVIFVMDGFYADLLNNSTIAQDVPFSFVWRDAAGLRGETVINGRLTSADLATIRGGGTVTKYLNALLQNNTSVASVLFAVAVSSSTTDITINRYNWLVGSFSVPPTGAIYDLRILHN